MDTRDAVAFLEPAVRGAPGTWADLGAGSGTFTRALAEILGPSSRVYAVDRDASALRELRQWSERDAPNVVVIRADITRPFALADKQLDGILLANVLHFVRDADQVLARIAQMLRPGGRVVIVEYDRRTANRWVPYPIPVDRLTELASSAALTDPRVVATRPSEYQGALYAAVATR